MVQRPTVVTQSVSFQVLRPSIRQLLILILDACDRRGGAATLYTDQLEAVGSRRIYIPGMSELHALGFIEVVRRQKRFDCRPSARWRDITSKEEAMSISASARATRMVPQMMPQPATASPDARA